MVIEACSLSKDSGTCRKYSVQYYYDFNTGTCRTFWYGGCQGNENRFLSQEECENVCINPDSQGR